MLHAFSWLPAPFRWVLLVILAAATTALFMRLTTLDRPLRTGAAPLGVLSYEFAWNAARAARILDSWAEVKDTARRQITVDFAFLVVYPLLLSLACAMLTESPHNTMAAAGVFISWAVLAAAPLDALENYALLRMLDEGASGFLARLAGWCAGLKFALVLLGVSYIVVQVVGAVRRKISPA